MTGVAAGCVTVGRATGALGSFGALAVRALPPTCTLPVAGFTGAGRTTGALGSRGPDDSSRSRRARIGPRSVESCVLVSLTSATSNNSRASGAWRISINTSPSTSMARTVRAVPRRRAWSATSSRWPSGNCTRSLATDDKKHSRNARTTSSVSERGSEPCWMARAVALSARAASLVMSASTKSDADCVVSTSPPDAATSSSALNVSRAEPPPWCKTWRIASSLTFRFASLITKRTCSSRSTIGRRWNWRCWVRLRIVSLTFCGSVVASTNTTCGGGSSRVFSNAASAGLESMWTSSRMNTRCRPGLPSEDRSIRSRMLSTPLLLAASSSNTS